LWHPDTAASEPADYSIESDRTTVPLHLAPRESVFAVFRAPTTAPSRSLPRQNISTLATLSGPWKVTFPPNLGAPPSIEMPELKSWTADTDPGVKYFSGTDLRFLRQAPHFRRGNAAGLEHGQRPRRGLVNGTHRHSLETAVSPGHHDASAGENQLQIKVTNEWTNRSPATNCPGGQRILAPVQTRRFAGPSPLLPDSGLLGPVKILSSFRARDDSHWMFDV
jgi:hypothetical protein